MLQGISLKKRGREGASERASKRERERERKKERHGDQSSDGAKVFYSTLCRYLSVLQDSYFQQR